nr:hypothetical protein [Arthrobacter sp. Bi26]
MVSINHVPEFAPALINGEPDRTKRVATRKGDSESEVCPARAALRPHAHFEEFLSFAGCIRSPVHEIGDSHIRSERMYRCEIIHRVLAQQETLSLQFHVFIMP